MTPGLEKLNVENASLQKKLDDLTLELEYKNRELEIEAALERVRARSMAMHVAKEKLFEPINLKKSNEILICPMIDARRMEVETPQFAWLLRWRGVGTDSLTRGFARGAL